MTPYHEVTVEGRPVRFAMPTDPATCEKVLAMYRDGAPMKKIMELVPGLTTGWVERLVRLMGCPPRERWQNHGDLRFKVETFKVFGVECHDLIGHVRIGDQCFRLAPGEDAGAMLATVGTMYRQTEIPMRDIVRATGRSRRLVREIARALGLPVRPHGGSRPKRKGCRMLAQM